MAKKEAEYHKNTKVSMEQHAPLIQTLPKGKVKKAPFEYRTESANTSGTKKGKK